jgi:hypothetical protein
MMMCGGKTKTKPKAAYWVAEPVWHFELATNEPDTVFDLLILHSRRASVNLRVPSYISAYTISSFVERVRISYVIYTPVRLGMIRFGLGFIRCFRNHVCNFVFPSEFLRWLIRNRYMNHCNRRVRSNLYQVGA